MFKTTNIECGEVGWKTVSSRPPSRTPLIFCSGLLPSIARRRAARTSSPACFPFFYYHFASVSSLLNSYKAPRIAWSLCCCKIFKNIMPSNTEWNENEIKLIEFMRKNPQYISPMYNNWSKPDLDKMWSTLSTSLNIPKHECRQKWYNIKNKYTSILTKKHKPIKTKYLDGKLSFLDKYILNTNIKTGSHVEPDTDKATDSDEDSGEEDFVTIDLKMIEDLLVLRGEPQKDNEISKMDNILSVVSKRIDEALSSYIHLANKSLNKPESLLGVQISKSNEVTWDVEVQDNLNLPCKSNYTEINEMVSTNSPSHENMNDAAHDVPSTSMAKNRCRTSLLVKERPDKDDMETIFDIHQSSDSESFYLKLEKYIKRFSVVKQEEIRLKICYLITELEMEED